MCPAFVWVGVGEYSWIMTLECMSWENWNWYSSSWGTGTCCSVMDRQDRERV